MQLNSYIIKISTCETTLSIVEDDL